MLSRGSAHCEDTNTPFGRAFYKRQAPYFVIPYSLILLINLVISSGYAAFWSIPAVAVARILQEYQVHLSHLGLFDETWYRPAIIFGLIATAFIPLLLLQFLTAVTWVVGTKWLVIGRRHEGRCAWDTHSYCEYVSLNWPSSSDGLHRPTMATAPYSFTCSFPWVRSC